MGLLTFYGLPSLALRLFVGRRPAGVQNTVVAVLHKEVKHRVNAPAVINRIKAGVATVAGEGGF